MVVRRIASISFVAAASGPERSELEGALRALVSARGGSVVFRYITYSFVTFSAA